MPRPSTADRLNPTRTRTVRLTRAGQITIPKPMLDAAGVTEGTVFTVEPRDGAFVFTPKTLADFEGLEAAKRASTGAGRSPVFKTIAEGKRWLTGRKG